MPTKSAQLRLTEMVLTQLVVSLVVFITSRYTKLYINLVCKCRKKKI